MIATTDTSGPATCRLSAYSSFRGRPPAAYGYIVMEAYRVFIHKPTMRMIPVGLAIGFKPPLSEEHLELMIVLIDDRSTWGGAADPEQVRITPRPCVYTLPPLFEVLDQSQGGTRWAVLGRQVPLVAVLNGLPNVPISGPTGEDICPEPDLLVWRSPAEFTEWQLELA